MLKEISHDTDEIFFGTIDHFHPYFQEEAEEIAVLESKEEKISKQTEQSMEKIKALMGSYYRIYGSSKSRTGRMTDGDYKSIAKSKGDLDKIGNGGTHEGIKVIIKMYNTEWGKIEAQLKNNPDAPKNEIVKAKKDLEKVKKMMGYITTIEQMMMKYKSHYERGYETKSILVMQEYEASALMLLIGAVNTVLNVNVFCLMLQQWMSGKEATFHPGDYEKGKPEATQEKERKFIEKILKDLATELGKSSHESYLKSMNEVKKEIPVTANKEKPALAKIVGVKDAAKADPEVVQESACYLEASEIQSVISLVAGIRDSIVTIIEKGWLTVKLVISSVFGIVPLIRSIIFLNYKKKISAIIALEENTECLKANIEALKANTKMNSLKKQQIINAQEKKLASYKKRILKMKAEFDIMEEDAQKAVMESNKNIGKDTAGQNSDDDLVLS